MAGLDIGTTNAKAAAYTLEGSPVSLATRRLASERPRPGWEQYDPDVITGTALGVLHDLTSQLGSDARRIRGIAVTSMGETAIPVDAHDRPVHAALAWHDARGTEEAEALVARVGSETLYGITGLPPRRIFGLYKLLWLRNHEPEAASRLRRWCNVADYVAYRLSGELAMDRSLASRTSLLDLRTGELSEELLTASGVSAALFPPLADSGAPLGRVTPANHEATGLPTGAVVTVGGHDHPCGALGMGLTAPGDTLDSLGTAESVFCLTDGPSLTERTAETGYEQGHYLLPSSHYAMGGVYTSGAAIDWAVQLLDVGGDDPHRELVGLAKAAEPGSGGVLFLPHLRLAGPPNNDNRSRAAFVGMSDATGRPHLARAVIEGLAYEYVLSLRGLSSTFGLTLHRCLVIGGGAANELGLAIKHQLIGLPLERSVIEEPGTLGAAMLGAVGAGLHEDVSTAAEAMRSATAPIGVAVENPASHHDAYHRFEQLYNALAPINRQIATSRVGPAGCPSGTE